MDFEKVLLLLIIYLFIWVLDVKYMIVCEIFVRFWLRLFVVWFVEMVLLVFFVDGGVLMLFINVNGGLCM